MTADATSSPFWFFKHLCWRCSIRSTCSKISMSRLFLRSTSLALCQLVKDMKEVCKTHCHFKKRKHTHTHLQLQAVKARWKEMADFSFSGVTTQGYSCWPSREAQGFQNQLRDPQNAQGVGARKGALGLHNWPNPLQSTQLTWSTSLSGAHCSASCKSH